MNKIYTFALIILLFVGFTSCETETDPIHQPLIGTYERAEFSQYFELDIVTFYKFSKDGKFELEAFLRNPNSRELVHYFYVVEGNFRATQNTIVVENVEQYSEDPYRAEKDSKKEDLIKGVPGSTSFSIKYELRNNTNEFFIPGSCIDDTCSQDESFERIN